MTRRKQSLHDTARLDRGLYRLQLLTKLLMELESQSRIDRIELITLAEWLSEIAHDIQAGQTALVREQNDLYAQLARAREPRREFTVVPS